jgi:preprotein translocase subunit SecG
MTGFSMFLLIIHVLISVLLITLVLMQPDKSQGGIGAAFGGNATDNLFGGSAATSTAVSKVTTYLAVIFMILSLTIAIITAKEQKNRDSASKVNAPIVNNSEKSVVPSNTSNDEK